MFYGQPTTTGVLLMGFLSKLGIDVEGIGSGILGLLLFVAFFLGRCIVVVLQWWIGVQFLSRLGWL